MKHKEIFLNELDYTANIEQWEGSSCNKNNYQCSDCKQSSPSGIYISLYAD